MDPEVVLALIAAGTSLLVAIVGFLSTRSNQRSIEVLKASLAEQAGEQKARRDYEYEARKRLYEECEPLLFQFSELAENGLHRIYSLARSSRQGSLTPGSGWLAGPGYYMDSTLYTLFVPLTVYKLMQRLLTLVDLSLDPHIEAQYVLAKALYISFTDDFDFARVDPAITYQPNHANWHQLRQTDPVTYWRQGIPVGRLDKAVESLLVNDTRGPRIMSFAEYEVEFYKQNSALRQNFLLISDTFTDFHPRNRPILWRMLVTQAHLYNAVRELSQNQQYRHTIGKDRSSQLWQPIQPDERWRFGWHLTDADADLALKEPFSVAETYLKQRLQGRQLVF